MGVDNDVRHFCHTLRLGVSNWQWSGKFGQRAHMAGYTAEPERVGFEFQSRKHFTRLEGRLTKRRSR
jgi:hypothetical protein